MSSPHPPTSPHAAQNPTSTTPAAPSSLQLLSMAQQMAQQDVRKMFAGIQKTHSQIFEEARLWDGKLPVAVSGGKKNRKHQQQQHSKLRSHSRNYTNAKARHQDDDTSRNPHRIPTPSSHYDHHSEDSFSTDADSDADSLSDQNQYHQTHYTRMTQQRKSSSGQRHNNHQRTLDRRRQERRESAGGRRSHARNQSPASRKPPSGKRVVASKRSKRPTTSSKLQQKRMERRMRDVSTMSEQRKMTFDESTMMEAPVYHDENIQTSPYGEEVQVQHGEPMILKPSQLEEDSYYNDEPTRFESPPVRGGPPKDPRKEEIRRQRALQSLSPNSRRRVLRSQSAQKRAPRSRTAPHGQPSPSKNQHPKGDEHGAPPPAHTSRLHRERAKRKRILNSAPRSRIPRAPNPSQLHAQHSRIAEMNKQKDASKWHSRIAPLPLKEVHHDQAEDAVESRRSSFSARMLPREALDTTQPQRHQGRRPQTAAAPPRENTRKHDARAPEPNHNQKPTTKLTVVKPSNYERTQAARENRPQHDQAEISNNTLEHTAHTHDISNLSDTEPEPPSVMMERDTTAEQKPNMEKLKLFERLKMSLLKNRSQMEESHQEGAVEYRAPPSADDQMKGGRKNGLAPQMDDSQQQPEPFVLNQTRESSVQVETVIEKPKTQDQSTHMSSSPESSPQPRKRRSSSPKHQEPSKRSSSTVKYEVLTSRKQQSEEDATTKIKKKLTENKVTFEEPQTSPNFQTPKREKRNPQLRLSLADYQRSLNHLQMEELFDLMDAHNEEEEAIRKRLLESKRSPSVSLSSSPTSVHSTQEAHKKKDKKREQILSQLRDSTDLRRSSFNVSAFLSPIRSKEDPKVSFYLTEEERGEILSIKQDNESFWKRTAQSIGDVCSDVEPHVLFEIIADVIQEEVFEECAEEVKKICDETVQNLFKAEFDASSFEFNDSNMSRSMASSRAGAM